MRTTRIFTVLGALILSFGLAAGCSGGDKKAVCGNGVLEKGEQCDGTIFRDGASCQSEGWYAGTLTCNQCTISDLTCHDCGNGTLDEGEECDGTALGGATCESEGYTRGELGCTASCYLDETGCVNSDCDLASFTSVDATAWVDDDGTDAEYLYEEVVTDSGLRYILTVFLWGSGGNVETGDHTLGVGNEATFADCVYCVYLDECLDSACDSLGDFFFATAGTLGLDALGDVGDTLLGDLVSVSFTEWDWDADEPIADGECIDLDSWDIEGVLLDPYAN